MVVTEYLAITGIFFAGSYFGIKVKSAMNSLKEYNDQLEEENY